MIAVAAAAMLFAPAVTGSATAQQMAGMSTQDWYQRIDSTRKKYEQYKRDQKYKKYGVDERQWIAAEIKVIDIAAGKLTIFHGPIPIVDLPSTTVSFLLRDLEDIAKYEVGDHVLIRIADDGGVITIVQIRDDARRH